MSCQFWVPEKISLNAFFFQKYVGNFEVKQKHVDIYHLLHIDLMHVKFWASRYSRWITPPFLNRNHVQNISSWKIISNFTSPSRWTSAASAKRVRVRLIWGHLDGLNFSSAFYRVLLGREFRLSFSPSIPEVQGGGGVLRQLPQGRRFREHK